MALKDGGDFREELDQALLRELGGSTNPILVEHLLRPQNIGVMDDPDGEAILTGICEDTVRVQLRLKGARVQEVRFMTNGCGATVACGSMATQLAHGRILSEAIQINGRRIIDALGGLPIEFAHCADLAANTLKAAVRDALKKRRQPWERLYGPKSKA